MNRRYIRFPSAPEVFPAASLVMDSGDHSGKTLLYGNIVYEIAVGREDYIEIALKIGLPQ
jgi:hypothetical protein